MEVGTLAMVSHSRREIAYTAFSRTVRPCMARYPLEPVRIVRCVFSRRQSNRASGLPPSEMAAWRAVSRVLRSPLGVLRNPLDVLRSPLDAVGCAVFPSSCRICNRPLLHLARIPVCVECWRDLPEQSERLCVLCGEQLGFDDSAPLSKAASALFFCQMCERAKPPFAQAVAYGAYENTLRALIHLLKYERIAEVARPLGSLLAKSIASIDGLPADIVVVAVPLHPLKERERGFNQTALLAEGAVRHLRRIAPERRYRLAPGALGRNRVTESQSRLTFHQRRRNLRGAFFAAQPALVAGRAVLLVDDIYTTGATARECSRTLLRAGAISVHVATLARSQREGVARWDSLASREVSAELGVAHA